MESGFEDKELGRVELWRNSRARRIKIIIKPDHLRITLPPTVTEQQGLNFLNEVRHKIKQKQASITVDIITINEKHPLQTLSFITDVRAAKRDKVFFRLSDGVLLIEYPENKKSNSDEMQEHFRNGIRFFLRKEAKRLLPERLTQLANIHGFKYKDLKIQSSKTRWGSCSGKRNINLSFYLLMMPAHLVDYVMLHELCHTKEMNHGDKFWKLMDTVTDNKAKALRKEVKNYRCTL